MVTTSAYAPSFLSRLARDYDRALRVEESAATLPQAWRAATKSEIALRRLQAARLGRPLPEAKKPRNARSKAADAFAALATVGKSIARAVASAAGLAKARAVTAAKRAAKLARSAFRRAVGLVASLLGRDLRGPVVVQWGDLGALRVVARFVASLGQMLGEWPSDQLDTPADPERALASAASLVEMTPDPDGFVTLDPDVADDLWALGYNVLSRPDLLDAIHVAPSALHRAMFAIVGEVAS